MTRQEGTDWLATRNLPAPHEIYESALAGRSRMYLLPTDSGAKTSLARSIANGWYEGRDVLFCIVEVDVWETSQNMFLFEKFRASTGDTRFLYEADCHLFGPEDSEYLEALLALALYFVWGAFLVDSEGKLITIIDDDERVSITTKDEACLEVATRTAEAFQLNRMENSV
jgi:hypothetical protein